MTQWNSTRIYNQIRFPSMIITLDLVTAKYNTIFFLSNIDHENHAHSYWQVLLLLYNQKSRAIHSFRPAWLL